MYWGKIFAKFNFANRVRSPLQEVVRGARTYRIMRMRMRCKLFTAAGSSQNVNSLNVNSQNINSQNVNSQNVNFPKCQLPKCQLHIFYSKIHSYFIAYHNLSVWSTYRMFDQYQRRTFTLVVTIWK